MGAGGQGEADESTFEGFYRAELDGQVRRAFLLTGSNEAANDLVHDAMVEVYGRWSLLDRPGAYLNTAVVNRCRDRARHARVADRAAPFLVGAVSTPDVGEQAVTIERALAGLPFRHRAAIVLRFYAGLTADEIAVALGCSAGSVGPWITRGLAAMREELS
jgi:RNA polymerase sigma factor (sigma-70 family)